MDPLAQQTNDVPVKCLVSSAIHRTALNPRYGEGVDLVVALLLQRLGGSVELTEAEARAFRETGQSTVIEAYGETSEDLTQRGWKLRTLSNTDAIQQSVQDIFDTIKLLTAQPAEEGGKDLGRFDA